MRLIEETQVVCQRAPGDDLARRDASRGLLHAEPPQHPFGGHADVASEQALKRPYGQPGACGELRDAQQLAVGLCEVDGRVGLIGVGVTGGGSLAQELFHPRDLCAWLGQGKFCGTCGVRSFANGTDESGKESVAINLHCLQDFDEYALAVEMFDGAAL